MATDLEKMKWELAYTQKCLQRLTEAHNEAIDILNEHTDRILDLEEEIDDSDQSIPQSLLKTLPQHHYPPRREGIERDSKVEAQEKSRKVRSKSIKTRHGAVELKSQKWEIDMNECTKVQSNASIKTRRGFLEIRFEKWNWRAEEKKADFCRTDSTKNEKA